VIASFQSESEFDEEDKEGGEYDDEGVEIGDVDEVKPPVETPSTPPRSKTPENQIKVDLYMQGDAS
jgi:hypothetical protein